MCDKQSLRSACAYAQADQSLSTRMNSMTVKLLTEQHLEFQSLKGGFRGSSESKHVKIPHCWNSNVAAHVYFGMPTITFYTWYMHLSYFQQSV